MSERSYDYIIVGAGTAGCVLANRLSADPAIEVLLIEAGRDYPPGSEPASIRDPFPASYGDPQFSWQGLKAEIGAEQNGPGTATTGKFVQGKMVGGSSSIMGMMAQRGLPDDFDEWQRLGADGWDWKGVLPYFCRLETDWDFDGELHGKDGPIPIRRTPPRDWPPFSRAVAAEWQALGYPFEPDFNGSSRDAVTAVPMNNTPEHRVSAATGYLTNEIRARPNLTILPLTHVERLIVDGTRVLGVMARTNDHSRRYRGREVIVSAGAIHSPAILLRSGIGPAATLRSLGITPVADIVDVGRNLANHAIAHIAVHLPRRSMQPRALTSWAFSMLRFSSNHPDGSEGDMQLVPSNRSSWHPLGWRIGTLGICLYKPLSRGQVELVDADPMTGPRVSFRLLTDSRDMARMADGMMRVARTLTGSCVRKTFNLAFLPPGGQANALNRPSRLNWFKSLVMSWALDLPFGIRRLLLGKLVVDLDRLGSDPEIAEAVVRRQAAGLHHPAGTCRMGRTDDPEAVVDPQCRVRHVAGLRVADASIMPTIVSGNTHLAALMIGEKAAQIILDGRNG